MIDYTLIDGFYIKSYFLTGEIPYGNEYPENERIGDATLTADCLVACAVSCMIELPVIVFETLIKASNILGMSKYEPILPTTGDGFIEYAKRSGLL
jgi:hypothetical protein